MKKLIAFAGSNSRNSINKKLATYAGQMVEGVQLEVLDLNDYPLPIYGIDLENEIGIPENAKHFLDKIKSADGIIVSLAEHNGAYATVFKNIFDWMSRLDGKLWSNKPMLLMSAAPGGRGGKSVLEIAEGKFPRMDAQLIAVFSLPFFNDNFKDGQIIDADLNAELKEAISTFQQNI